MPLRSPELPDDRPAAQARADRIRAFRAELERLQEDGVLELADDQRRSLDSHHQAVLAELAERFDVDVDAAQQQMSLGLRIASFLGALALSSSAVLFFRDVWGSLTTTAQVAILVGSPSLFLAAAHRVSRRERTPYVTSLLALLALACFVLMVHMLGRIFNLPSSAGAFLAWGLFAVALGRGHRLRLPLAAGLTALGVWTAGSLQALLGHPWWTCWDRPESFLPAAVLALALPSLRPTAAPGELGPAARITGSIGLLWALLSLSELGFSSYLSLDSNLTETLYAFAGLVASGLLVALGLARRWAEVTWSAATFFALFLLFRFVDWWWDWMPRYLFFLVVGLVLLGLLFGLRRLRDRLQRDAREGTS